MAAPFKCDEKVTIEQDIGVAEDEYGTKIPDWQPLLVRYWANVQDELPSRAESVDNGLRTNTQKARLRMQGAGNVTGKMRAVLHNRDDKVMQIVAGPAMLDDRVHYEFRLEAYV